MNQINSTNIKTFIAQLYRERKGTEAPQALLDSWQHLSNEEIAANLRGLFESWGMGEQERTTAMQRFLNNQNKTYTPPPIQSYEQPKQTDTNYTPSAKKRASPVLWIVLLLVIGVLGYFTYQYLQYAALNRIYAITENIAIRDIDGKSVGRMDLYEKDKSQGSYSSLRAMDNEVHFKQPEGSDKEYPTRRVMADSVGFMDFVFKKNKISLYVNVNYIVNDKEEYELYQSAFKEIAEVPSDNAKLTVVYRKVIVGSMAKTKGTHDKFVASNRGNLPANTLKNTDGILLFEKKKGSEFVVIASLNDGNFYQFEGDINTNTYKPLQLVNIYDENNVATNLSGAYRFIRQGDKSKLYNVADRNTTNYELSIRNDGMDYDFVYVAPVVHAPVSEDSASTAPAAEAVQ